MELDCEIGCMGMTEEKGSTQVCTLLNRWTNSMKLGMSKKDNILEGINRAMGELEEYMSEQTAHE